MPRQSIRTVTGGWLAALAALVLSGCGDLPRDRVDPADHDAFFLWAGVPPPAVLDRARRIYVLAGEVRRDDPGRIVPLRAEPPRVAHAEVWLTIRAERLDWSEAAWRQLEVQLARWAAANPRFAGLQVDFDARTQGLDGYADFLATLRRRLPRRHGLSVTGLMDWSARGDPAALARLAGTVDEVVIQTYQGRTTIPGYEAYLARLRRVPLPYRIALVENGEWRPPPGLASDPDFRGYVVFLLAS